MDPISSSQSTASNTSRPISKLQGQGGYPGDNSKSRQQQKQSPTASKPQPGLYLKYDVDTSSGPWKTTMGEANEVAVDIIATHGLGADGSTWVWKHPEGPRNLATEAGPGDHVGRDKCDWLGDSDMLPAFIPNSRIFFFEWNANFEGDASTDILLGHADTLLQELHRMRNPIGSATGKNYNGRPIIFVASCFGGLLLIKALQRASELNSRYKNILNKTIGVSFMGVPFLGSHDTLYNTCHLRLSLALHLGAEANGYLVEYLLQKNHELDEIVQRFCEMVDYDELRFPINCFYETHRADYKNALRKVYDDAKVANQQTLPDDLEAKLKGAMDSDLTMVVVDRQSACLQGKERIALDVPHAGIKRFPGPTDRNFRKVAYQLRVMADNAGTVLQAKAPRVSISEKTQKIGRILSSLEFSSRHNALASQRVPETGNWFLGSEMYKLWVKGGIKTLSCEGIAGSGKTIMASIVIDHLVQHFKFAKGAVKIAYIYCQYDLADQQGPVAMIKDLLKQLLLQCRVPPLSILSLYEKDEDELRRIDFQDVLKAIATIASTCSRILVVVDAVDESKDGGRELLSHLSDLIKRMPESCTASLLLTSRSDHNVRSYLPECQRLTIRATNEDINMYLDSRMTKILPGSAIENRDVLDQIKITIANAADGMFLLAHHYLHSLADKLTDNTIREALRSFVAARPRSDSDRMADLRLVYIRLIERINQQQEGFQVLAKNVLSWTTFANRPLTLEETLVGLSIKPGQCELHAGDRYRLQDVISACTGLITIDSTTNTVRLSHRTAHEFLEEHISWIGSSRMIKPSAIDVEEARVQTHREIAQACITYLCFDAFKDGPTGTWGEVAERFRNHKLLGYAAVNWVSHARAGHMDEDSSIQKFLERPLIAASASQAILYELDLHSQSKEMPLMGPRMNLALLSGPRPYASGLHLASIFGLTSVVKYLLLNGHDPQEGTTEKTMQVVDPELCAPEGMGSPMSLAASRGHKDVVRILYEDQYKHKKSQGRYKSDMDLKRELTKGPLKAAFKNAQWDVVDFLVEKRGQEQMSKEDVFKRFIRPAMAEDAP